MPSRRISACATASKLLEDYDFIQTLAKDNRQKRFIDVQRYFQGQVVSSCPARLLLFLGAKQRGEDFRAEPMEAAEAVSILMREFIAQQQFTEEEAHYMLRIFSDMVHQAPPYRLWLTPNVQLNAKKVQALLAQHRE